jgi:hypothetical protein
MTATAPIENWEDTFTYHGATYHVTRAYHRWVVSDGLRTEGKRSLVEALDALLDTIARDDELLDLVVRLLSSCWMWPPASPPEQPQDGNGALGIPRPHNPGR